MHQNGFIFFYVILARFYGRDFGLVLPVCVRIERVSHSSNQNFEASSHAKLLVRHAWSGPDSPKLAALHA